MESELKLFSGLFVEVSKAQLDNGNIVLVTNQKNDQESKDENDQLTEQKEETEKAENELKNNIEYLKSF